MRRRISRRTRRIILALICVPLLAVIILIGRLAIWYHGFNQRLQLADKHAPIVRSLLQADSRFSDIDVGSFTGDDGCLLVVATVEPRSANDLKKLVASTAPPVHVRYILQVRQSPR